MLGWMYLIPLVLLFVAQGRFYYLAPAYPMLLSAGSVVGERWLSTLTRRGARLGWGVVWGALAIGAVVGGAVMLPVAPINSATATAAGSHSLRPGRSYGCWASSRLQSPGWPLICNVARASSPKISSLAPG